MHAHALHACVVHAHCMFAFAACKNKMQFFINFISVVEFIISYNILLYFLEQLIYFYYTCILSTMHACMHPP